MYDRRIEYYAGQGDVLVGLINEAEGKVGKPRHVSNAPELKLSFSTSTEKRKESMTGEKNTTLSMTKEKNATFEATLESFSVANIEMVLFGKAVTVPAGNFVHEITEGQENGDLCILPHPKISTLAIKDRNDVELERGVHYDFDEFGTVEFIDVAAPLVQPFTATGQHESYRPITIMTDTERTYFVRFQGLNTINGERVLVELYKAKPEPSKDLALISDDPGSFTFSGELLADMTKGKDETLGYFGRIIKLGAKTTP